MTYATAQDIQDAYGDQSLPGGGGESAAVGSALAAATAEINAHIARRYDLPLTTPPDIVKSLCVDIAVYKLCADSGLYTEERRQRYEDAISLLKRVADGKADLGITNPKPKTKPHATFTARSRDFTRQTMAGL